MMCELYPEAHMYTGSLSKQFAPSVGYWLRRMLEKSLYKSNYRKIPHAELMR
jgi:hypothetical protein